MKFLEAALIGSACITNSLYFLLFAEGGSVLWSRLSCSSTMLRTADSHQILVGRLSDWLYDTWNKLCFPSSEGRVSHVLLDCLRSLCPIFAQRREQELPFHKPFQWLSILIQNFPEMSTLLTIQALTSHTQCWFWGHACQCQSYQNWLVHIIWSIPLHWSVLWMICTSE